MSDPQGEDGLHAAIDWLLRRQPEPYPHQEEAVLELLTGANVLLTSPTGSGKSLVAEAAVQGLRTANPALRVVLTAPIKALVGEQFRRLTEQFGKDVVGIATGDVSIQASAPILCCTAEILANRILRAGSEEDVDLVVMDEFHYYSDPQRGWAWQIPLLELPNAQFLLMSATIGPTGFFCEDLAKRTGRRTVEVTSNVRPVPLEFEYLEEHVADAVAGVIKAQRHPVYIVHSEQALAKKTAQHLSSQLRIDKEAQHRIRAVVRTVKFDTPVGSDLRRYLDHGIGVHHAGLLPKYRLMVEKLAQDGLLTAICGTDTLGVGVNVPIRSVMFTRLCKYDGQTTRILRTREFLQIAGRAGRRGYDDRGYVYALAPEHVVLDRREQEKVAAGLARRARRHQPGRGIVNWNQATFDRLRTGQPEPLTSSFSISAQMVMSVLDRVMPADAPMLERGPIRRFAGLLVRNHEARSRQRMLVRDAIAYCRSLVKAGIIEVLKEPDEFGRTVRVNYSLQDEYTLHRDLALLIPEFLVEFDSESEDYALAVLSIVEAVVEDPRRLIEAQNKRAWEAELERLKARGVDYEERMRLLENFEPEVLLSGEIWATFESFRARHPWIDELEIRPKVVAREIWEMGHSFSDCVRKYEIKGHEGELLRYLTDVYKGLVQNVAAEFKTEGVFEIEEWLGEFVRQIDSSLLDEWEGEAELLGRRATGTADGTSGTAARSVTANAIAFRRMVRNAAFRWVRLMSDRKYDELARLASADGRRWTEGQVLLRLDGYFDEHEVVELDQRARGDEFFDFDPDEGTVRQIVLDPGHTNEWQFQGLVDIEESNLRGEAVLILVDCGRCIT